MKPTTLRERVDSIAHDLAGDDTFFSSVLDRYIEKKAEASTPKEVLRIADQVEKETGLSKEAALHTAWETYLRYVNPDFVKEGGKIPPQFMKGKKGEDKDEKSEKDDDKDGKSKKKKHDEKSEKKDEKGSDKKESKDDDEDEEKDEKKPFPFKSAAAIELAEKLGMKSKLCVMTKEAPKSKKMEPKTAAAKDLAKALGV